MRASDRPAGSRFLENLAHLVPGYAGYREKDHRRDEDARLRSRLLQRLLEIRGCLSNLVSGSGLESSAGCSEHLESRAARLDGIADAIRYAPYGFSGFFDAATIREDALDRILEADLLLFYDLDAIERACERIAAHPRPNGRFREAIEEADRAIEGLERHLIVRDKLLGDA